MNKLLTVACAALMACGVAQASTQIKKEQRITSAVPDAYIVQFKDDAGVDTDTLVKWVLAGTGVTPKHVYRHTIQGFAATLPPAMLAVVKASPWVKAVSADRKVYITATEIQTGKSGAPLTWGLDRVDQRLRPNYSSRLAPNGATYKHANQGENAVVYVIDTGVNRDHVEFETSDTDKTSRVTRGVNFAADRPDSSNLQGLPVPYDAGGDCQGHGSHVAGTVGGRNFGVAKKTEIISVRVLTCAGTGLNSGVLAGMDWAMQDYKANFNAAGKPTKRGVANMSLGGDFDDATDAAVAAMVKAGLVVVVAAGNDEQDACLHSPARERTAITVGATEVTGQVASYSNYGPCVDVLAPGSDVVSVAAGTIPYENLAYGTAFWLAFGDPAPELSVPVPAPVPAGLPVVDSNKAVATLSGTSMASPHVAGWAAQILTAHPNMSSQEVLQVMQANATTGATKPPTGFSSTDARYTTGVQGSPDRLMYNLDLSPRDAGVPKVAVKSMLASSTGTSAAWKFNVRLSLKDAVVGMPANKAGLQVRGYFSNGTSAVCTTDAQGQCTLVSEDITDATATFTIASILQKTQTGVAFANKAQLPTVLHDPTQDVSGGKVSLRAPR